MSTATTLRVYRTDPSSIDRREQHHRATFSACHLPSNAVLVTVEGEVDAANGRSLASYVERQVVGSARLLLDLNPVSFFGTAGFGALHSINVICCRYGVSWVLMMGPPVRRILDICDPDGTLPIAKGSVVEGLHAGACDRELLVGGNH